MTNPMRDKHNAFLRELWAMNHLNTDLQTKVAMALDEYAREIERLHTQIDCACNALTDSICVSGNDAETNLSWVRKLRAALSAEHSVHEPKARHPQDGHIQTGMPGDALSGRGNLALNDTNADHALNCPCAICMADPVKRAALNEMRAAQKGDDCA